MFLKNHRRISIVLFVLAFLFWIYYFRVYYTPNRLVLGIDAQTSCVSANYFLEHISRGVFPAWKPFTEWGRPDDFIIQVYGELNPFLLSVSLLQTLGVSFFLSYFIYLIGYYFLGLVGFYLLIRRITQNEVASHAAALLLMFSNMSTTLFNDVITILLFVPMVWFFYFVVRFFTDPDDIGWMGLTLTLMMMVVTYIPTMFLTVVMCVLVVFTLIFPDRWPTALRNLWTYIRRRPRMAVASAVCVGFCVWPGLIWMLNNLSGEYVAGWRGADNAIKLSMAMINQGGLVGRRGVMDLFTNLDVMAAGDCYVPIFAFIVVLLGAAVRINRKLFFLILTGFLFLALSAGDVSAIYVFLYQHLFFIKTFRNLHFILWFAVPVLLIFTAEVLRVLLDYELTTPLRRAGMIVYALLVHVAFAYFLTTQDRILISSYWVIGLSAVFFTLYYAGLFRRPAVLLCLVTVLIIIQPAQVISSIRDTINTTVRKMVIKSSTPDYVRSVHSRQEAVPVFSFVRPPQSEDDPYEEAMSFADVKDASGFMEANFLGLRWSWLLHEKMDRKVLSDYVRHKFVVYDGVEVLENDEAGLGQVQNAFAGQSNVAFVASGQNVPPAASGRARVIEGNSPELTVRKFDLNVIRFTTDFPEKKFLVYNDCYQKDWKATVNGRPAQIFRANVAFKGLWLDAGKNTVEMRYRPGRQWLGFFLIFLFQAVLWSLVALAVRHRKGRVS